MSTKADAALLTLNDGTDVWTLDVQTGCTTCLITLKVVYGIASGNAGQFIDAVQWDLTDPNVNPTSIGFQTFSTSGGGPAASGSWAFSANGVNANQCGAGDPNAVCGAFTPAAGQAAMIAAGGFGPIASGSTLTWTFMSTFASALNNLNTGNIRAAYNTSNGQNFNIFSPNGGSFTGAGAGGGSGSGQTVPEPATLTLVGLGMLGAAYRARRQTK